MRYYLIAGEASGDLHASNLMRALQVEDPQAEFRFFGGDQMAAVGGTLVRHYRDLAYMGFIQVALHASTILKGMKECKADIVQWHPDVLILVDYPGFNLSVAKYIRRQTDIPIYYYISPKIWAWKEWRIKAIRRDVDELFSILPFEVPFFAGHHYPIHYIGNPCVDAVDAYRQQAVSREAFLQAHGLGDKPIIALLAGSRKAEIKDNLPQMIEAVKGMDDRTIVIAGAPGIDKEFYAQFTKGQEVTIVFGETYPLLQHAYVALVTSGTATLETALFRVPQVVCYFIRCGKVVSVLRRLFLKVPFISLVNLIADKEVVPELVADGMNVNNLRAHLCTLNADTPERTAMLQGYDEVIQTLGEPGASSHAAQCMVGLIQRQSKDR